MTSIELEEKERGDMELIAKQHSGGNISKYIRDLIWDDHQKQLHEQQIQKTDKKTFFMQNTIFLVISATFLILGFSLQLNILDSIAISLLVISGLLIIILVVLNHKKYKLVNLGV